VKRAEITLVWRREAKVEEMSPEHVSPEGETGKELVFGYDKDCRPVLYMHPYRQNTETGTPTAFYLSTAFDPFASVLTFSRSQVLVRLTS